MTENDTVIATQYWHKIDDGRIQYDVCPRSCKLRDGQRGLCYVRGCEEGEVKLYTYGRSTGYCIDPIKKKPLNHFLSWSSVLSFGTFSCNLACKFCQNLDMSKSRGMDPWQIEPCPKNWRLELSSWVVSVLPLPIAPRSFLWNMPLTWRRLVINST